MKDTKIFYAIQHLDNRERGRFKSYLESPYFNKDSHLLALFEEIVRNERKIAGDKISREAIWKRIRSDKAYNHVRLRKYCSTLVKHLEGFLYHEKVRDDRSHEYVYILDALHERRMEKLYGSVMRSARESIEKSPRRDGLHFQRKYQIEKRYYELNDSELKRAETSTTQEIADALDNFYVIEKLRIQCSVLVKKFFLENTYELKFLQEIYDLLNKREFESVDAIQVYRKLISTYSDDFTNEDFDILVNLIHENSDKFELYELNEIYSGAINHCVSKSNHGEVEYLHKTLNIVEFMLQNEILNAHNEFSPWKFKNAILSALRVGKYDWALDFINNYNHYLPDSYRDTALDFNYAQVYFYRKEYDEVLSHLQRVEYQDPTYALNSRALLSAVYYEQGDIDPLYSAINSFRKYLRRQTQLSDRLKRAYLDYCNVTLRLAKATSRDEKGIAGIRDFLEENKGFASRQWVATKLKELQQGERKW